jgi:hypothetical protein
VDPKSLKGDRQIPVIGPHLALGSAIQAEPFWFYRV